MVKEQYNRKNFRATKKQKLFDEVNSDEVNSIVFIDSTGIKINPNANKN